VRMKGGRLVSRCQSAGLAGCAVLLSAAALSLAVTLGPPPEGAETPPAGPARLKAPVSALAFSPDGRYLAVGDCEGSVRVATLPDNREGVPALHACSDSVVALAFSPDSRTLSAAGCNGSVGLWKVPGGERLEEWATRGNITGMALSPDRRTLAVGVIHTADGLFIHGSAIHFYDLPTGRHLRQLDLSAELSDCVNAGLVSRAGPNALADSELLDAGRGRRRQSFRPPFPPAITLAFLDDGSLALGITRARLGNLVGCTTSGALHRYDMRTGERSPLIPQADGASPHFLAVNALSFSPPGSLLAVLDGAWTARPGYAGNEVSLWKSDEGRLLHRFAAGKADGPTRAAVLSPDTLLLATGGEGQPLRLWELSSGRVVSSLETTGAVFALTFSPDGGTLAAGLSDGAVLLWDGAPAGWKPSPPAPAERELERLWEALRGPDAAAAYRAMWQMSASSTEARPWLEKRLRPFLAEAPRIRRLVAALDADDFARRQAATRELASLGEWAEEALCQAEAGNLSLELRQRARQLLEPLRRRGWVIGDADMLAVLRSVQVLERMGTPEARRVLREVADNAPLSRQAQAARAALVALDRRPAR
jgi:hypothetical protein